MSDFQEFPKIARLSRECVITEKIDGTNAQIYIESDEQPESAPVPWIQLVDGLRIAAGSRNRYLTLEADNYSFARWVHDHADELSALGPGRHFGEWWGGGIQRGYGLPKGEKRFSLFNVARWHMQSAAPYMTVSVDPRIEPKSSTEAPACCHVVPVLYRGQFTTRAVEETLELLMEDGSVASCGFDKPEGIVIYHTAANLYFKKTIEKDAEPKGRAA